VQVVVVPSQTFKSPLVKKTSPRKERNHCPNN